MRGYTVPESALPGDVISVVTVLIVGIDTVTFTGIL